MASVRHVGLPAEIAQQGETYDHGRNGSITITSLIETQLALKLAHTRTAPLPGGKT